MMLALQSDSPVELGSSDHSGAATTFSSSSVGAVGLATSHNTSTSVRVLVVSIRKPAANGQNEQQVDGCCHHASCPPDTDLHISIKDIRVQQK